MFGWRYVPFFQFNGCSMKKMIGAVVVVVALVAQVGAAETAKVSESRLSTLGVSGLKSMSDAEAVEVRGSGMVRAGHMGMVRGALKANTLKAGSARTMNHIRNK